MRKKIWESIGYLMLHSEVPWDLWVLIFSTLGIMLALPQWVMEFVAETVQSHRNIEVQRLVPL